MLVIIAIYMVNFFYGKTKNYSLVNHWFQTHRAVLEKNFAVVGDDGLSVEVPKSEQNESGSLIKDSESNYALWCTGRHGIEGMLIQLKLIKRQDLINGTLLLYVVVVKILIRSQTSNIYRFSSFFLFTLFFFAFIRMFNIIMLNL